MAEVRGPLPEDGDGVLARDFIPESHRHLPMLRIFLPLNDRLGKPVRWSKYIALNDAPASLDWFELVDRVASDRPEVHELVPCRGELDAVTAEALREAVGDVSLHCLRWVGYWGKPQTESPVRVYQKEYAHASLRKAGLEEGQRVPEFAWDDERLFAWGTRLYPDSLVVAAQVEKFRQLRNDPRLDTVSIAPERDILPSSSGD
ncbi:MAG: hypothetical protein ABI067_14800 [Leifsonia sp.]